MFGLQLKPLMSNILVKATNTKAFLGQLKLLMWNILGKAIYYKPTVSGPVTAALMSNILVKATKVNPGQLKLLKSSVIFFKYNQIEIPQKDT